MRLLAKLIQSSTVSYHPESFVYNVLSISRHFFSDELAPLLSIFDELLIPRCRVKLSTEDIDNILGAILNSGDPAFRLHFLQVLPEILDNALRGQDHLELLLAVDFKDSPATLRAVVECLSKLPGSLYEKIVRLKIEPGMPCLDVLEKFQCSFSLH
jgi:hypothetical protein